MIEELFSKSRFLVFISVLVASLSAVALYLISLNIAAHMLIGLWTDMPQSDSAGKEFAVSLLKVMDLLFIAITFQIIAVSLYRLFITPVKIDESKFLNVLDIRSFHDLKVTLMQVSAVILTILFLERAVEFVEGIEILYFGLAIAVMIAATTYAWTKMDSHKP